MTRAPPILIVEDEPPIRRLLRTTLGAHDYRTLEAATGAEALSALRHHRPDLVLLDLGLPDIDGLALIGRIREISPVPIVVLSSRGDEAAKVAALDAGADDYVTKPFGADELMARLRAALRHRLQEQGAERDLRQRRSARRPGAPAGAARARGRQALAQGVRHPGAARDPCRQGADPQAPAARGVARRMVDPQYLRVYVRQLRQKIEADPSAPRHVLTEPGVGYRLV